MFLREKVAVVTGGAAGIGRALCLRFAAEGARGVVVADRDFAGAQQVAKAIDGLAVHTDVGIEADLVRLVDEATQRFGQIDLFCSNAGIVIEGGIETSNFDWERIWNINLMAHVHAARAVLPAMVARGQGYLLQTASAAGLLSQIGSAPYSVTKHAAVAFAEWLAIHYADLGIGVSCLCPLGVRTDMLARANVGIGAMLTQRAIEPEEVAAAVIQGLADERFFILPHEEVTEFVHRKANDPERWLRGMRRLHAKYVKRPNQ